MFQPVNDISTNILPVNKIFLIHFPDSTDNSEFPHAIFPTFGMGISLLLPFFDDHPIGRYPAAVKYSRYIALQVPLPYASLLESMTRGARPNRPAEKNPHNLNWIMPA